MAYALPSVSFDLVETRVSGADTVTYVPSGTSVRSPMPSRNCSTTPNCGSTVEVAARARVAEVLDWQAAGRALSSEFSMN